MLQQVRTGGGRLDHGAVRREVAAQHRDSGVRLEWFCESCESRRGSNTERRRHSSRSAARSPSTHLASEHRPRPAREVQSAIRRRRKNLPSDTCLKAECQPGTAVDDPSRSKSSRHNGTPIRPAIAIKWITALVEPPMAAFAQIAFSKASRVRICDMREIVAHHLDDASPRHLRQRVAARIDRRNGRIARQAHAQRFHHVGHG